MQDLKVVIVQSEQFWENKTKNYLHFEKLIGEQVQELVDLVLLPEMFNTGFTMNVSQMAETIDGESIHWLMKLAKEFNTCFGASLIIKQDGKYFNKFVLVEAQGIIAQYNKRHLFRMAGENNFFTPGQERVVVNFKTWNILLQVCYDLRFPVFSRNKTISDSREYDLAVYIANWPEKRSNVWKILLQARAIENQSFVIGVNRVGSDDNGISYSGDSMLVDPWGNIKDEIESHTESVKILTLKKNVLAKITAEFPAFRDAD